MRIVALLVALWSAAAAADECVARDGRGVAYAVCFDPGNRLTLFGGAATAEGSGALGGGLFLRHVVTTDDPGVTWRFEHALGEAVAGRDGWRATVYRGRYLRHSRDGHLVLPTNPPRKLFLHSDLGFEVTVGAADARAGEGLLRVGAVRAAVIADVLRAPDFSRRLSFGLVARWDLLAATGDGLAVVEHHVAPLTVGAAALHLESADGLSLLDVAVEGGERWSDRDGFGATVAASASLERVLIAVNDRSLALYFEGGWDDERGARLLGGVRVGVMGRER